MPHAAFLLQANDINTQSITVLIILLLLLLVISFALSGAQTAFFSLTYKDINLLKTKQQQAYKRVIDLLENPKILHASLLIANTAINIIIVIVANLIISNFLHVAPVGDFVVKVLVIAALIILCCEVLPKMYATQNNIRFAKDFGFLIEASYLVCNHMGAWLVRNSELIEKKLNYNKSNNFSSEEMSHAIDITYPDGKEEEKDILLGVLKFGNITVKQIMRTRLDISGIEYNTPFSQLVQQIEELHYSRLPIYKGNLDNMVGVLNTKDLLPYIDQPENFDWHTLMRTPYFVHEHKLIEELLKEFQSRHIHFAIVVDEFGGTSGIATLEDIMEEVIGDIRDEFDEEELGFKKLDENNYIFDGKIMINDVCKIMQLPENTFDKVKGYSDSLAGLVLEIAGFIPQVDQEVSSGDFSFTVLELEKNRLQKIKISIQPHPAQ
ncbi:gliding motility-associated protein GldE [Ilyomonas limi]|uniref:Gliding motility-associated protein GldE n=1 Tax=Ilyomonas limi TaxID=2575867 RepID=A0A4V5UTB8_9BACT|nr:gliding motility-associated protein GldE [Ilyomonas limi]TKK64313.1 gliding motility-associated protein GldE [Ilyomonas limi]